MNARIFLATLAAVAVCQVVQLPTMDDKFFKAACGGIGQKTLTALEGECANERERLDGIREDICDLYNDGKGDGLEKAQKKIETILKSMPDVQKTVIFKCLREAYKNVIGVTIF